MNAMIGEVMQKTLLLAVLLAGLIATTASPAMAQTESEIATPDGAAAPRNEGSLYRGAYEVTEDGTLIIGGDVVVRCQYLVKLGAPSQGEDVDLCAEAGFPPEGAVLSGPRSSGADALPETGGITSPPMTVVAAILAVGAHLILRAWRQPTVQVDRR